MSASLSAGQSSLLLNINAPVDTDGELRDDVLGAKVWYSTTSINFNPALNEGTLVYEGNSLNITIPELTAGTTYYVKYAIISDIDPDVYTISSALSGTPIETTQAATVSLYQWSPTQPNNPTGTSTFTWATATNSNYTGTNGWEIAIPSNPGTSGLQLWQASKQVTAYPTDATSNVDWSTGYAVTSISRNGGDGVSPGILRLVASGNAFTYDSTGTAAPASQTLTLTAILENLSGIATFTATRYNTSNTEIDTITLGGTDNTRTITHTQFGNAAYCVITATLSGKSDTQRLVRLANGGKGDPGDPGVSAITGLLTNESAVVAAGSDGTVASFGNAGGTFKIWDGITDKTNTGSVTYSVVPGSETGVSVSILNTGIYSVNSMSSDTGTATFRAVYGGVTIDKTYSIAKSRQGNNGTNGLQSAKPTVYQWALSLPAAPSGTASYIWASGSFGTAPIGWTLAPGEGSAGQTLYAAGVAISDSAANTTTSFNWTNSSITVAGYRGTNGTNGNNGTRTAVLELYQWASSAPTLYPSGTSTYTWATGQFTSPATLNNWTQLPGTPTVGQTLYGCSVTFSDSLTTATSTVTWNTSSNYVLGKAGTNGNNGTRTAILDMYKWSATQPTTSWPTGTSTYTWATATFTAPATANSWTLTPGTPVAGQTLWIIRQIYTDSLTDATSAVTWATTGQVARALAAAGTNGNNGDPGSQGASARMCYSRIANNPSPTSGSITVTGDGRPTQAQSLATWGLDVAWSATDPSPTSTNTLYQSDGLFNPATGNTVWTTPYISSLKVGSLSAITTNTGALTVSGTVSTANGNFSVSSAGAVTIRSATSGARTELTNSYLKVYDSTGTLRVQIGDLAA